MNNDIIKFLNIEDKDLIITDIIVNNSKKEIHIEKVIKPEYCPACSS